MDMRDSPSERESEREKTDEREKLRTEDQARRNDRVQAEGRALENSREVGCRSGPGEPGTVNKTVAQSESLPCSEIRGAEGSDGGQMKTTSSSAFERAFPAEPESPAATSLARGQ